ncbi:30S ribosomal protein S9 [Patescibacteria group bacterium]|nr:30S ribosomal protein S9 [Patescibacteria group bacterium]
MTKINKKTDETRAVGRRKCASARVKIDKGTGKFTVNGQEFKIYFPYFELQDIAMAPLKALAKEKDLDIAVKVTGGGKKGQAEQPDVALFKAGVCDTPTHQAGSQHVHRAADCARGQCNCPGFIGAQTGEETFRQGKPCAAQGAQRKSLCRCAEPVYYKPHAERFEDFLDDWDEDR